jgi:hypothetical protein
MSQEKRMPGRIPDAIYVKVNAEFMEDGSIYPRIIFWEGNETCKAYEIDLVLDYQPGTERKEPGQDDRYTVLVNGRRKHLFFERNLSLQGNNIGRWYVERK